ncbi:hypothetical protein IHV82_01455 [Mycobacterium avium]|uniref:hypothetical protein n=1 Tax=Mycobacterium avium TaxID=1764 RepID=UPI0009BE1A80|nr:hypothetical protein [Mycobacterium avium]WOF19471.1 hypothetical protein IHV82_01455 [Mycobacterium avium]
MTWHNGYAIAAVAAAAAVMSACSTATGGAPVAVQSATVAASSSAETEQLIRWVDVEAEAPQLDKDLEGLQYGTLPVPGLGYGYRNAAKQAKVCTLGPAVRGADGRTGFLTAGHCTAALAPTPAYLQGGVDTRTAPQVLLGNVEQAEDDDATVDSAVIWAPVPDAATKIAGRWPVAGIMTRADVPTLVKPGDPVCVLGARSGVVCSPLVSATGRDIRTRAATQGNDSGGAVFVVAPSGSAIVIGIHRGVDGSQGMATFVSPALDRLHVTVATAAQ